MPAKTEIRSLIRIPERTVLVVQGRSNKPRTGHERKRVQEIAGEVSNTNVSLRFANAVDREEHHPWDNPAAMLHGVDRVVFMGSGDIDLFFPDTNDPAYETNQANQELYLARVTPLVTALMEPTSKTEVVGICLGAQVFHLLRGGELGKADDKKEIGTTATHLTEHGRNHPRLSRRYPHFDAQYGHNNFIVRPGNGLETVFATTKRDPFSITGTPDGSVMLFHAHIELDDSSTMKNAMELSNASRDEAHKYFPTYPIRDTNTSGLLGGFFSANPEEIAVPISASPRRRSRANVSLDN